jgi:hypothetical protein
MMEQAQQLPQEKVHPVLQVLKPNEVVNGFKRQLELFWRAEWPFNESSPDLDPLKWWQDLQSHPQARVLAVCFLFFLSS